MKKIKLHIYGMHCASCASNIEKSLRKINGIKEVNVNAIANKAFIEAEDETSESEIKKAVTRIGYKVVGIEKE